MIRKMTVSIVTILLLASGLAACDDTIVEENPQQGSSPQESSQSSSYDNEEEAVASSSEESVASNRGFVYTDISIDEIARLDAEGASIDVKNPEGVRHVRIARHPEITVVKVYLFAEEYAAFRVEVGRTGEETLDFGYTDGDTYYVKDIEKWLTKRQKDAVKCVVGNGPIVFEIRNFTDTESLVTIPLDNVENVSMVSPSCEVEGVSRRSTQSDVMIVQNEDGYRPSIRY